MDRIGKRAEHAVRQHDRRLADGLGAIDRVLAVGVGIKRDAEIGRHVGGDRNLVGGGRMREQAALLVEDQLLGGEPAHALHEAALDLADIDGRIQRASDIVEDVDAPHVGSRR